MSKTRILQQLNRSKTRPAISATEGMQLTFFVHERTTSIATYSTQLCRRNAVYSGHSRRSRRIDYEWRNQDSASRTSAHRLFHDDCKTINLSIVLSKILRQRAGMFPYVEGREIWAYREFSKALSATERPLPLPYILNRHKAFACIRPGSLSCHSLVIPRLFWPRMCMRACTYTRAALESSHGKKKINHP